MIGSVFSYVVKNLQSDVDYEFRISAENQAGVGAPSPPSDRVRYGASCVLLIP